MPWSDFHFLKAPQQSAQQGLYKWRITHVLVMWHTFSREQGLQSQQQYVTIGSLQLWVTQLKAFAATFCLPDLFQQPSNHMRSGRICMPSSASCAPTSYKQKAYQVQYMILVNIMTQAIWARGPGNLNTVWVTRFVQSNKSVMIIRSEHGGVAQHVPCSISLLSKAGNAWLYAVPLVYMYMYILLHCTNYIGRKA